jgi:hypothetical protein
LWQPNSHCVFSSSSYSSSSYSSSSLLISVLLPFSRLIDQQPALRPFITTAMHQSFLRAATTATRQGLGSKSALALLPPISLYRRLLRAHRKHLPSEMRLLGDEYIKAEFRAHRNIDNPAHLVRSTQHILGLDRRAV